MENTPTPSSQPAAPATQPSPPPAAPPPAPPTPPAQAPHPESNRFKEIKSLVIKVLIGCLVAAAGVSVVAVLVGGFSETMYRSLLTLVLVAAHALAALTYISTSEIKRDEEGLSFFSNVVFVVIVLSFITSVLGTWEIISGDVLGKAYATYFIFLFAALHGNMLHQARGKTSTIDNIIYVNYVFMAVVIAMLLPVVYIGSEMFADVYYRILAAAGIIDATLTILAVSLHRLYLNKHPEQSSALFEASSGSGQPGTPKRHTNPLLILLGAYIILQILGSVMFGLLTLINW
jgi:hypothetical protein